ncbi:MAG: copper homeostasis protein CutC [Bacteroidota bacterium]
MKRNQFELEICANSVESVTEASRGGADRVELSDNLYEGGTTPSAGTLIQAKRRSDLPVFVIIRPRGGDFCYDDEEVEVMLRDIELAKQYGADGMVLGCLNPDGTVDHETCSRLIEACGDLPVTFHRAFDMTRYPLKALETIRSFGVSRLLTSGQKNKAIDGADLIAKLQEEAGKSLKIMAGGGINEQNIAELAKKTNITAFHASLTEVVKSSMQFRQKEVSMGGLAEIPEYTRKITSAARVRKVINLLEGI